MENENTNAVKKVSKLSSMSLTQKIIALVAIVLVYTVVVCSITVAIDRAVIRHNIEKAFTESFGEIAGDDSDADKAENIEEEETKKPEEKRKQFKLKEKVVIKDAYEFVINKAGWAEEIKPNKKDDFYSYYENQEGSKYFVLRGTFKNLSGDTIDVGDLSHGEMLVNSKYKANFSFRIEEADGGGFDSYIKPLETLDFVIFASVSDELYKQCENIEINLDLIKNASDISFILDDDVPVERYAIRFDNTK